MSFYESTIYYTKIDNNKIKQTEEKYKYTLVSYKENGDEKNITFETTRILRSDAYIKVKYMITRGVVSWEEVKYEDLPEKVKIKYQN